ncbi:unnamed protein product [Bemisia tabaci]|uniref:Uncharacterized protein n=1 Tax=Bemisia tabaci TaxID=7038 RepID=A0A9P0AE16_BEMTA|nr:unnamed protein product [Bemisia tabaci]
MRQVAQQTSQEVARKRAKIVIALFMAEHNMPFNSADHLVIALQKLSLQLLKASLLNRTKCTKMLTNVVSKDVNETLIKILQAQEFTLLLHESTDRSADKHLSLVVRLAAPSPTLPTQHPQAHPFSQGM